ncbi:MULTISPECIES: DUF1272 domain-containing protein [unclassified Mesorhizobium]|uniref:DUF1272 domain-containing protein n=1 Tax=unclassified Mesorhizobium TaxID=325217 RepID=UPI001128C135|nr:MULTISPECIES: DUF1272 domain-containing protein [unclassified Mesorhizobium]MBZ9974136.1 DUF1272 domain-containing protein [Mesorhizobium sp. BR-1-1-10]TPK10349.1 DUF1272 domain-containing protein [Mesorhizobium sp. B2-5-7]
MLEIRPNCEWCDRDLPPGSSEARICSYECTYCAECVSTVLHDVCPTCGGNFSARPIRPRREWRAGFCLGLEHDPASSRRTHSKWTAEQVADLARRLHDVAPEGR